MLKTTALIGGAAAVLLMMSACADDEHMDGHRHYAASNSYDVWYDGGYGAYTTGYWGDGDVYYYSDGHGGFTRDDAHHFRRQRWEGANGYHSGHHPD
jgi:hypothetical protein